MLKKLERNRVWYEGKEGGSREREGKLKFGGGDGGKDGRRQDLLRIIKDDLTANGKFGDAPTGNPVTTVCSTHLQLVRPVYMQ